MKSSTIVIALIALLLLGGGWYWYSTMGPGAVAENSGDTLNNTNTTNNTGGTGVDVGVDVSVSNAPMSATVTLTANGFSPRTVTVKGGTVTWVNESTGNMWVGSASHPTHTVYDGTSLQEHCSDGTSDSFDQCKNSDEYSFTFDKIGTWNYHNHSGNGQFGSVTVIE